MKMFKLLPILILISISLKAQFKPDKIHLLDDEVIDAKIMEVKENEIVFKEFYAVNSPLYKIETDKISHIVYANGYREEYNSAASAKEEKPVETKQAAEPVSYRKKKTEKQEVETREEVPSPSDDDAFQYEQPENEILKSSQEPTLKVFLACRYSQVIGGADWTDEGFLGLGPGAGGSLFAEYKLSFLGIYGGTGFNSWAVRQLIFADESYTFRINNFSLEVGGRLYLAQALFVGVGLNYNQLSYQEEYEIDGESETESLNDAAFGVMPHLGLRLPIGGIYLEAMASYNMLPGGLFSEEGMESDLDPLNYVNVQLGIGIPIR